MYTSKDDLVPSNLNYSDYSELHSELTSYLEDKVAQNTANNKEIILYENYKKSDTINIDSEECRKLLEEMKYFYKNGYR